ncbi:MAG TPA: IS21 family transposase [Bacteroidetes bacterium]|nr:IS21 family transposase [Bacteroidota bacterium]
MGPRLQVRDGPFKFTGRKKPTPCTTRSKRYKLMRLPRGNQVAVAQVIRTISRELVVSRKRIRRVLVSKRVLRDTTPQEQIGPKKRRPSKLYPYKKYISELLEKYPDITAQRIFELICEKGFDGEITILRYYLKQVRQVGSKTPLTMVETDPGQRANHNWSDYNITFTLTGETRRVTFFSYILSYSRRQYMSLVDDKTQGTLFQELISAFIYLDGVPLEIKSDNQKACVDHWEMGKAVFNRKSLEFATHYRFRPLTITPGKPTENLKAERPFYYFERSFLKGRQFRDREDLRRQLYEWLTQINDQRIHGTTCRRPIEIYQDELPFLQRLPVHHFDTSQIVHLTVNQESCVQWKGYHYVVPQQYMHEVCVVRITEEHLEVYSPGGGKIAAHPLAEAGRKERYVGKPNKTVQKSSVPIADVIRRLEDFSPEMEGYIQQVKRHKLSSC